MNKRETSEYLLTEADYVFNVDNWEATHSAFGTLLEEYDLTDQFKGQITTIGRLLELPKAYAVNIPISFDEDDEPDEWEVFLFRTQEEAVAAYDASRKA